MATKFPPVELHAALDRARDVSARLATATDKLNVSLQQIETELAALNLGVTAAVEMEQFEAAPGLTITKELRFGKADREWKLLYESGPDTGDPDNWSSTPLLNASRENRLLAVAHLPKLIKALVDVAEKEIKNVSAKADEVEALARLVKTGIPF